MQGEFLTFGKSRTALSSHYSKCGYYPGPDELRFGLGGDFGIL